MELQINPDELENVVFIIIRCFAEDCSFRMKQVLMRKYVVVDSGCHTTHGTTITSPFCGLQFRNLLLVVISNHSSVLNSRKYFILECEYCVFHTKNMMG